MGVIVYFVISLILFELSFLDLKKILGLKSKLIEHIFFFILWINMFCNILISIFLFNLGDFISFVVDFIIFLAIVVISVVTCLQGVEKMDMNL